MKTDEATRKEQGERLRAAREEAGYASARSAALANGWPESSNRAHEGGTRTIGQDDAERYARRFRQKGAKVTGQSILYGAEPEMISEPKAAPEGEQALSDSQTRVVRLVFQAFLEWGMTDPTLRVRLSETAYQAALARSAAEYAQGRKVHQLIPDDDDEALAIFRLALALKPAQ